MEYFVLQAKIALKKGDNSYSIPGLKNNVGSLLNTGGMTPPTQASVDHGIQEWIIPNNAFNQSWISQHFSQSHKILLAGEERLFGGITTMEGMPAPLELDKNDPLVNSPAAPIAAHAPVKAPEIDTETPAEIPQNAVVEDNSGLEAAEAAVARIKEAQAKKIKDDETTKAAAILAAGPVDAPLTDEQLLENAKMLVAMNENKDLKGAPEVIAPDANIPPVEPKKKMAPQKIAKLKAELTDKLTELGVEIPRNSTLPDLEKLLNEELKKVS